MPQACIVLAAALFINYICCGAAAGSAVRFDGLRQALDVGCNFFRMLPMFRQTLFILTLLFAFVVFTMWTSDDKSESYKIIVKTNSLPGDIDTNEIKKLNEPLKAVAAFYSSMGGTMCDGETCELTTALGLGKQGSDLQKNLIKSYFPDDKAAKTAIAQDCYLRPSGASTFSDFQYLTLVTRMDTVKVLYVLMRYDHGKSDWIKGPDIYLLQNNKFKTIKRKIWDWADKK